MLYNKIFYNLFLIIQTKNYENLIDILYYTLLILLL